MSLTASLKVGQCEVLLQDLGLVFFVGERPKGGELPEDNSSSVGGIGLIWHNGLLPSVARDWMQSSTTILHISSTKIVFFFLYGPATSSSHDVCVQPDPITLSSASLVPPVSSPFPSDNVEIDLLAIGSSGCLTSRLSWTS